MFSSLCSNLGISNGFHRHYVNYTSFFHSFQVVFPYFCPGAKRKTLKIQGFSLAKQESYFTVFLFLVILIFKTFPFFPSDTLISSPFRASTENGTPPLTSKNL